MKVKWGALIVDGRGKIGGHVASVNRAGAYMRTKVTPVNPNSSYQVFVRNNMTANAIAWKGLTAGQRLSFNNAVNDFKRTNIFGDIKVPSGFNLFCSLNNNIRFIGGTPIVAPPLPAAVGAFATFSATAVFATQVVTLTYTPAIPATATTIVCGTPGLSAGRSFVKSDLRKFDLILTADASPFPISTEYIAKFGAVPAVGTKIFFTMQQIVTLTGLAGAKISCSCVTT